MKRTLAGAAVIAMLSLGIGGIAYAQDDVDVPACADVQTEIDNLTSELNVAGGAALAIIPQDVRDALEISSALDLNASVVANAEGRDRPDIASKVQAVLDIRAKIAADQGILENNTCDDGSADDPVTTFPMPTPEPSTDPSGYPDCDAVIAAGVTLMKGDDAYRPALDRDNDGLACNSSVDNGDLPRTSNSDGSTNGGSQISQIPRGSVDTGDGSTV